MNQSSNKLSWYKNSLRKVAITTLATSSLLIPMATPMAIESARAAIEDSPKTIVDEVWQIVNNEYVDRNFNHQDWQQIRQELLSREYNTKEEAYRAIRAALKQLGDRYTRFLPPRQFEALTSKTSGELSGIGIVLEIDKNTSELRVVKPLENSPASFAGIESGDVIIKINNKPTSLMSVEQASEEIKGDVGTNVVLEISRPGQEAFEVTITRAKIELPSLSYTIKQEGEIKVGYIKLDEFSSHAAEQMEKAIAELSQENVSAYVLDLRGNPGGLLFASVDIARMWMKEGSIVRTVDRRGGDRKFSANNTALTDLPLVVLVNGNSASASEILAGALKDNERATIVGTNTYGKGTVQSVHTLSDGSGLAVTISRYYPPSGINISRRGIAPDINQELSAEEELRLKSDPELIATPADPQYMRAISVLRTTRLGENSDNQDPISIR